jgi:hypothetical protein
MNSARSAFLTNTSEESYLIIGESYLRKNDSSIISLLRFLGVPNFLITAYYVSFKSLLRNIYN